MKHFLQRIPVLLSCIVAVTAAGVSADERLSPDPPAGLSFRYERPAEGAATNRQFVGKLPPVEGVVYVYATVHMGPANPIKYVGGLPEWRPAGAVVEPNKTRVPTIAKETCRGDSKSRNKSRCRTGIRSCWK